MLDLEDHFTNHEFKHLYWTSFEQFINQVYPLHDHRPPIAKNPDETDVELNSVNVDEVPSDLNSSLLTSAVIKETDNLDHQPVELKTDEVIIDSNSDGQLKIQTPYLQDYLL